MSRFVVVTDSKGDKLFLDNGCSFKPMKSKFLAPIIEKSDVVTKEFMQEIGANFVENEKTFSIFNVNVEPEAYITCPRYYNVLDSYVLLDRPYNSVMLTAKEYTSAATFCKRAGLFAEKYNEAYDVMSLIVCSDSIACFPESQYGFFLKICDFLDVKLLFRRYGFIILGKPFNEYKGLIELAVPEGLKKHVLGTGGRNIKYMSEEMNVGRILLI